MDHRDDPTWVALELTYLGETKVEEGSFDSVLRRDLGVDHTFPIFIPAATYLKHNKPITVYLLEGYVFVGSGLAETSYFSLEKKPYVSKVMSVMSGKMRNLSTVADSYIKSLQKQLRKLIVSDVEVGSKAHIIDGLYKNLEGIVIGLYNDYAHIQIDLRSIKIIATVPMAFLDVSNEQGGK
jgi:transcription antitermination factor NusG